MEAARHRVVVVVPDDDGQLIQEKLTAKQEAFVRAWVRTANKSAAYRQVYNVHPHTVPNVVWANASRLAALPKVEAYYNELVQQAALETIMSVRQFFAFQVEVATADPNELVCVVARCCRNCYGDHYRYQWRDDVEYLEACVKAIDEKQPTPSDAGGYGFNGAIEPNPLCPCCYGVGHRETIIADTTKLTGKARKLYLGAEQDRFGMIKVKMRDPQKAEEMIGRMLGVFKDADIRTPAEREAERMAASKTATFGNEDDAAKAYLSLVS